MKLESGFSFLCQSQNIGLNFSSKGRVLFYPELKVIANKSWNINDYFYLWIHMWISSSLIPFKQHTNFNAV